MRPIRIIRVLVHMTTPKQSCSAFLKVTGACQLYYWAPVCTQRRDPHGFGRERPHQITRIGLIAQPASVIAGPEDKRHAIMDFGHSLASVVITTIDRSKREKRCRRSPYQYHFSSIDYWELAWINCASHRYDAFGERRSVLKSTYTRPKRRL